MVLLKLVYYDIMRNRKLCQYAGTKEKETYKRCKLLQLPLYYGG